MTIAVVDIETKTLIALNNWRKTLTTLNIKNNDSHNIEHEEKYEDTKGMIKRCKTKKSRQYTDQKEEQTIHCPKGRADNTLAKMKSKQCTGQKEEQTKYWPKERADDTLAKRKKTEEQTMMN